jgi:hypothetical protein
MYNPNQFQQQQFKNFNDRSRHQFAEQQKQQIQAGYRRNREAEAIWRRKRQDAAEQAQHAVGQPESRWQNGSSYQCWSCQTSVRVGSAYCTNCGALVQLPRSAPRGAERPSSWKKRVGIMILITVAVLTLVAVLQAHSSSGSQAQSGSGTPADTPGVIIVGANIRTGPGTGNSIAATAPAGTKIVISCRIATPAGGWDKLASPYRDLFVSATLVRSPRPASC